MSMLLTTLQRFGLWGTYSTQTLSETDATSCKRQLAIFQVFRPLNYLSVCDNSWDQDSTSEIVWLIIVIILGLLFQSIAFSYYHQLLDPTSTRTRVVQVAPFAPQHYNRPYDNGAPDSSHSQPSDYATGPYPPPPGAPPYDLDAAKPPGYSSDDISKGLGYGGGKEDWKNDPFADFETRKNPGEEVHGGPSHLAGDGDI